MVIFRWARRRENDRLDVGNEQGLLDSTWAYICIDMIDLTQVT